MTDKKLHIVIYVISFAFVALVSFRVINHYSHLPFKSDAAMFADIGYHLLNNKVLYQDVWDHKQPIIFLLNYLALNFYGTNISAIREIERVFSTLNGIFFFSIFVCIFKRPVIGVFLTVTYLFCFYHPFNIFTGNVTEEYGTIFLLAGTLTCLFINRSTGVSKIMLILLSGFFYSLAVFCKEPFILSVLPLSMYFLLTPREKLSEKIKFMAVFIVGFSILVVMFFIYFIKHRALIDWYDILSYNLAYSKHYSNNGENFVLNSFSISSLKILYSYVFRIKILNILFIFGVVSIFVKNFVHTLNYMPLLLFIWFLSGVFGANIAITHYPHYYIPIFVPFILLSGCGAIVAINVLNKYLKNKTLIANLIFTATVLFVLINYNYEGYYNFYKRLAKNFLRITGSTDICADIAKNNSFISDTIWAPNMFTTTYINSGRLSATIYLHALEHYYIDTYKSTGTEKIQRLLFELIQNKPKFIIFDGSGDDTRIPAEVARWIEKNYYLFAELYECKILRSIN
ncbi:MAG: glycosyltransferase family 39 protein [Nitrospirae bacterium]|nr:glycosyltransferase family 39 protein [Nitrospirota bacterium]